MKTVVWYWENVEKGLCVKCGKEKAEEGKRRCKACNAYMNAYQIERHYRLKEEHRCTTCGAALPEGYEYLRCETCKKIMKLKRADWVEQRQKNGYCKKCGAKLPQGSEWKNCEKCRARFRAEKAKRKGEKA